MKITEILNNGKMSLSFEVFPHKTDTAFESVQQATREIAKLKPSYMSITYGAGGGTSKYTLDIAEDIMKDYGVPTLAHLTCVSSSKATVQDRIFEMNKRGIKNVLALRGDIPTEMEADDRSGWDHRYAVDLIREIKESGFEFCIGGACYPEIHPESSNQKEDIKHLKEKVDAGCEFLTTQMFFDNNLLYNFLYKIREAGITVPIVARNKKNAEVLRNFSVPAVGRNGVKKFKHILVARCREQETAIVIVNIPVNVFRVP